jgi:hypothetical protein
MIKGSSELYPELGIKVKFPYAVIIILILSSFLRTFFDSLACRYFIHFAAKTRSSLAGLIYKKTLLLNISA